MSTRAEVRTGTVVIVKARGPFVLPVAANSTGPFPFLDLVIPGGGYRRMSIADNGQELGAAGTGNNSLPYIDLLKPDQTVARVMMLAGGVRAIGVGVAQGARTHVDFRTPGGLVWRMTAQNNGQTQLEQQP